jgi:hypothetical protein
LQLHHQTLPEKEKNQYFFQGILKGKYHCTIDLLFGWFGLVCLKKIVSGHTADSKPVQQEVNGTVILPPLVFPDFLFLLKPSNLKLYRGKMVAHCTFIKLVVGSIVEFLTCLNAFDEKYFFVFSIKVNSTNSMFVIFSDRPRVLKQNHIVWLDDARPYNACIPPSCLDNSSMQLHGMAYSPQKYICKYQKDYTTFYFFKD